VAAALGRLEVVLGELTGLSLAGLSDEDVTALLDGLTASTGRLTHATTRAALEADRRRLGDSIGAQHTAAWWARRTRLTQGEAGRLVGVGRRLSTDLHGPVAGALAAGSLRTDQADVICRALDVLPTTLDLHLRVRARDELLRLAAHHDASQLRRLGKRILDVVAPEIGEAHEATLLQKEEDAADRATSFSLIHDGHGKCHGRFTLPSTAGRMLQQHLLALASPARQGLDSARPTKGAARPAEGTALPTEGVDLPAEGVDRPSDLRPLPERLGRALVEYVERYPADQTPASGGLAATVVVTMDLDTLLGGLTPATLDDGTRISAGQARRLACEAGIIPAVLGGASMPLDLGATRRFHSKHQRLALALRDGGCSAEGCEVPPGACHAHHDPSWATCHTTSVKCGRLFCPRHHRLAHHPDYEMRVTADNKVTFHRRR